MYHLPLSVNTVALVFGLPTAYLQLICNIASYVRLPLYRYIYNTNFIYAMRQYFPSKSQSLTRMSLKYI